MGAAGTGKSKLIHALIKQAYLEGLGHVIVSGYTGVSCAPFLTPTILTLFNINPMKLKDGNPSAVELEAARARFRRVAGFDMDGLVGLVIDEVSFMQPEIIGRISRLLQGVRGAWRAGRQSSLQ